MKHRFFISRKLPREGLFSLFSGEAHHLRYVLRLGVGEEVCIFDGKGNECFCRICNFQHNSVELNVLKYIHINQSDFNVVLACALSKGRKIDLVVEKATELGVSKIIPFKAARSVVNLAGREKDRTERWRRISVAAAKQCGRNWLPEIEEPQSLRSVLDNLSGFQYCLVADIEGFPVRKIFKSSEENACSVIVLVGPEGGFEPKEKLAIKESGVIAFTLGPYILRTETACIAAVAVILQEM
jgi:16S rRNA (uracil1498-N3)-methyltransferase